MALDIHVIRQQLRKPYAVYSLIALSVMLPMIVLPGYIFALDMAFTPQIRLPEQVTSSYLFYAVLHLLNYAIPSEVLQKIMLFSILLGSGLGMHNLMRYLVSKSPGQLTYALWGGYFAGMLYMINPFTYSRFMTGQFAVLLGYALLPWFVLALFRLIEKPTFRQSLTLAALLTSISIVSIHTVGLAVLLLCIAALGSLWHFRDKAKHIVGYTVLSLVIVMAASSYWLLPLSLGTSSTARAIHGFSTEDREAFATLGATAIDKAVNVLQLQGFWAESRDLYTLPQNHMPLWGLAVIGMWVLAGIGVRAMVRYRQGWYALFFGIGALVALIFATTNLVASLAQPVTWLDGYREPHKFVALVALFFGVTAGMGVSSLLTTLRQKGRETVFSLVLGGILLLPVVLTPTMFWAFGGQLMPKQYPPGWHAVNEELNKDKSSARTLFLPWHLYTHFGFAGRIIVNPAEEFFDRPTIMSNDLEFKGASPTVPNKEKTYIGKQILHKAPAHTNLGERLARHNIGYIILAREYDQSKYTYLDKQTDLQIQYTTESLILYRNLAYKER